MDEKNIYEEIGYRIKECRKEKKITQSQLGDKIGKSEQTIRKYEQGTIAVPLDVIAEIADVLETTKYDLLRDFLEDPVKANMSNVEKFEAFFSIFGGSYKPKLYKQENKNGNKSLFWELKSGDDVVFVTFTEVFDTYEMITNFYPTLLETTLRQRSYIEFENFQRSLEKIVNRETRLYSILSKYASDFLGESRKSKENFFGIHEKLDRLLDIAKENVEDPEEIHLLLKEWEK